MLKGFKLSIIAIAISAPLAHADISLGSDANHVSVNVNTDDGSIGDFTVYNGTNSQIATFTSGKLATQITTGNGNQLTVSNSGVSLRNSSNGSITLSGVANGVNATDAVNVSQLNNLSSSISTQANTYTDQEVTTERNARIAGDAATLASANTYTDQEVTTERNARIAGDAATLASANTYTDQRFNNIETKYQAAVASSIAIASLPQPTNAGHSMVSFSVGQWEKEQGYAVGVSGVTENNKWVYKAAGTGNSRGDFGGGMSFGFQWK
ncbi:YadA C-terminal domain-containing protein [Acinetobacter schindleri]|uniref:YadA C-terminal domain-containing protein n=1 Tax=Acinetobacter schindleri TaxID=108981 RepID=UPI000972CB15|nr:YadA C-terminal domain-containing protein [Acinetobacter schindleri]APX64478.1 YadA-like C-terminal domain-containing protein [Acinetobacter schindleri]